MLPVEKESHYRCSVDQLPLDLDHTGDLVKQLDFIGQRRTLLASSDISLLNECFASPSAHVRAKSVDVLASIATVKLHLKAGFVGDVILWHTDDGDARVRDRAFDCLRSWLTAASVASNVTSETFDKVCRDRVEWIRNNLDAVYVAVCRGLMDTEPLVRRTSLLLLAHLCSNWHRYELTEIPPMAARNVPTATDSTFLVDDAFSRVCSCIQDSGRQVRELAVQIVSDLAKFVSNACLIRTLGRTVISDRSVRRAVGDKSSALASTDKPVAVHRFTSMNSVSILPTGSSGALISGLEDDYFEVRCATLNTIAHIASLSAEFALSCQDLLVDMLTDDIQDVRLTAVTALAAVGDQVPLQSDQVAIITSAMTEGSGRIRRGLHQLLSRCRLSSAPCLVSLLDGLLRNLRRYPQDRGSLWQCAASVGKRHPVFVETCLSSLLRTHSWLSSPEPNWEDPAYLTVLILVLNAEVGAPGMVAKFPRHLESTRMYLRELVPNLLPKRTYSSAFSDHMDPTTFVRPVKSPRLDIKPESDHSEPVDTLYGFLHTLLKRIILLLEEVLGLLRDDFGSSAAINSPVSFLRPRLTLLSRLVFTDLQNTVGRLDRTGILGGFVHWLVLLTSIGLFLISLAFNHFQSATTPNIQSKLLKRAFHMALKAEHLFYGQTQLECTLISSLSKKIFSLMQAHCLRTQFDYQLLSSCLQEVATLLSSLLEDSSKDTVFESSSDVPDRGPLNVLLSSSKRLFPVCVMLLQPKPTGPLGNIHQPRPSCPMSNTPSWSGDESAGPIWGFSVKPSGGGQSSSSSAAPEVRFTATIASASIKIRSVVYGLNLETARKRLCVLFRRPDLLRSSTSEADDSWHSTVKWLPTSSHQFYEWWPPSSAWHPLDGQLSPIVLGDLSRSPISESNRVELRAELELTAGRWSDAGTIELGLGYRLDPFNDSSVLCSAALVLPVTPRDCFVKVKLIPSAPISHW